MDFLASWIRYQTDMDSGSEPLDQRVGLWDCTAIRSVMNIRVKQEWFFSIVYNI